MKQKLTKTMQSKWIDGRLVQGAYRQWLVDKHPEALGYTVLDIIARNTLGYRKRYAYINNNKFLKTQSSTWRQVKKLIEMNLLKAERTHYYTMYKLILPEEIETNTMWSGVEKHKKEEQTKTDTKGWG